MLLFEVIIINEAGILVLTLLLQRLYYPLQIVVGLLQELCPLALLLVEQSHFLQLLADPCSFGRKFLEVFEDAVVAALVVHRLLVHSQHLGLVFLHLLLVVLVELVQ